MSHHIFSILRRRKFKFFLLLLLLAPRGKQVHTVLHHCATLIQHPQRERCAHHHNQAHDITHETSFSTRCAQEQHASAHRQPPRQYARPSTPPTHARTRTHSELVGGGGRSCLRAVRLGVVLSCVLLASAPASRETSELQLSPPGGEEKEQNGSRNGDKLTKAAFGFRRRRPTRAPAQP